MNVPTNTPLPAKETAETTPAVLVEQLATVREMYSTLQTCSTAGQRYVMSKVVGFLEDQTSHLFRGLSPRNRRASMDLLTRLRHETDRMSPDVTAFVGHADSLLSLVAAVA